MKMILSLISLFSLCGSVFAHTPETVLVKIENNKYQDEKSEVRLVFDAGDENIWGLHYLESTATSPKVINKQISVALKDLNRDQVLRKEDGIVPVVKAAVLPGFSAVSGGPFVLKLKAQGLFSGFKTLPLILEHVSTGWTVYVNANQGKHDVNRAFLDVGETGIKTITLYDSVGKGHEYSLDKDL